MKIFNNYILSVALSLLLTAIILIAIGQNSLDVYYTVYIIEALVITELFVHFNVRARRGLTLVSIILFAGFVITLGFQVIKILT